MLYKITRDQQIATRPPIIPRILNRTGTILLRIATWEGLGGTGLEAFESVVCRANDGEAITPLMTIAQRFKTLGFDKQKTKSRQGRQKTRSVCSHRIRVSDALKYLLA
jgi:hypothetical protein